FEGATAILKSGGAAVVPGHPERSKLFERITAHDRDKLMPPADSGKSLTEAEIATLKQWIEQGAEYQPHWAFIPPKRPSLPRVNDPAWVRNPIDAFVLANLERNGLTPSPEADKVTLLRRVT